VLDERHIYLVPPCDSESDGELSVVGVRQARSLGDALGDVSIWAAYAAPGLAYEETAGAISQRHNKTVRPRPALGYRKAGAFEDEAERILATFESIARVGPGRQTLLVASPTALAMIVAHCRGAALAKDALVALPPASLTEVVVEEQGYRVLRVADIAHLGPLDRSGE